MAVDQGEREAALRAASSSLARFLDSDERLKDLLQGEAPPDPEQLHEALTAAAEREGLTGLRVEKRRQLALVAAHDLTGDLDLATTGRRLAELADETIELALELIDAPESLAVIGMGKLGGAELNYCSDIDLVFVSDSDVESATRGAEGLLHALGEFSPEGQAYRIDLNLRPEGAAGALVRSVEGAIEYYRRWADSWEFQALIKARPAAGNGSAALGFLEGVRPLVFSEISPERVASIRKMKERVEGHAVRSSARGKASEDDNVKLGPGGIRDIEFVVQLLQLVHGANDDTIRTPNTLEALRALVAGGYLADEDGAGLSVAYEWLRTVEHRLQLWQERQIHQLPQKEEDRARLARVLGFRDSPARSASASFGQRHRSVLADVRGRFEKLFYRPMIEALAPGGGGLSEPALKRRLAILGFRDVERAGRTLGKLVSGTSRRAALFRVLTPAVLRFVATAPQPDEGLFAFLRLGEALESRTDVLSILRDNPPALASVTRALGSGRVIGEWLEHAPEEVSLVADTGELTAPRGRERLTSDALASLTWRIPERRLDGLRRFRRRETLRIALADLTDGVAGDEVGKRLADLADACLEAALSLQETDLAIIAMGKLGGRELNYASDIDVMFVAVDDVASAERAAEDMLRAIGEVTPEGQTFRIDTALRPEGKAGPLVRSLKSYLEYYARWGRPWEHQALIKARPAAGKVELARRFVEETRSWAFPVQLNDEALAEIRHLKARMERERVQRGTDPRRNLKLGPGGASDVEFSAQLLQLQHAHAHSELQVAGTIPVLEAAAKSGLISNQHARWLIDAYRFHARLRNRLFFMTGRPVDLLPTKPEALEALGMAMGYSDQPRQELEEEYLRVTRRARRVAQAIIYG